MAHYCPGLEDKPSICLQCHMDMVVEKNDDVQINFETDPLTPRIVDNKWLMATGTSLGADDGIGVATCFAILADPSLKHGPLEVLITRDEETGMFGALELEPGLLRSPYLINVDSEEENALCIGCAGGFTVDCTLPVTRSADPKTAVLRITLNDFRGGHSGCDIDAGRANPLHVMGRLLTAVNPAIRVVSIQCGTADNAIPRKCIVEIAVNPDESQQVQSEISRGFDAFRREFQRTEPAAKLEIEAKPLGETVDETPIDGDASRRLLHFLNVCPFGVQRYSPAVKSDVETSLTCAIAQSSPREVGFVVSVRSSVSSQLDWTYSRLRCLADLCGMRISPRKAEFPRFGRFIG